MDITELVDLKIFKTVAKLEKRRTYTGHYWCLCCLVLLYIKIGFTICFISK